MRLAKIRTSSRRCQGSASGATDRGRWALVDSGEDCVEPAKAAKARGERNLGHRQIGVVNHSLGALDACGLSYLGTRGADMLLKKPR